MCVCVCVCHGRYLCNLGPPRRPLQHIRIRPNSCHVQVRVCKHLLAVTLTALAWLANTFGCLGQPYVAGENGAKCASLCVYGTGDMLLGKPIVMHCIECTRPWPQIVSTAGSSWKVAWRGRVNGGGAPTIRETVAHDPVTQCQSYELLIELAPGNCPKPLVVGTARSCETTCALVSEI